MYKTRNFVPDLFMIVFNRLTRSLKLLSSQFKPMARTKRCAILSNSLGLAHFGLLMAADIFLKLKKIVAVFN